MLRVNLNQNNPKPTSTTRKKKRKHEFFAKQPVTKLLSQLPENDEEQVTNPECWEILTRYRPCQWPEKRVALRGKSFEALAAAIIMEVYTKHTEPRVNTKTLQSIAGFA